MSDEVVARGRIKVDASKAAEKLRDHMLVDLHLYATEIARVAVATGAKELAIDWDADDATFTFAPERSLAVEAIARARDHVLAPPLGEDGDALRLLGIGISAALGLGPAFVDVHVGGSRVRFTGAADAAIAPSAAGLDEGAMRVHVRRRAGLETLARAVRDDVPREIGLLHAATRDAPIAIQRRGKPLGAPRDPDVLLRVDLDEPSATRAVLEVLAPSSAKPTTEWHEHGVRLATYAGVTPWELPGEPLPLRVVIDARRLPTNASRSEVRTDAELVLRVTNRVVSALEVAIDALRAIVVDGKLPAAGGRSVEVLSRSPEALEDALGAIASHFALAARVGGLPVPERVRAVETLPLLRDVLGKPLAIADLGSSVLVHDTLQPTELAPWLGGVVHARGRAVERYLRRLVVEQARERVERARVAHERRQRALAHAPSPPVVPSAREHLLRVSFDVRDGRFTGLAGELAIARPDGPYRRAATARLFVEERLLETAPLPAVALPLDLAMAWPGRIVARYDYDAVERNDDLNAAIFYALRVAALAIGEKVGDPELARLALAAWVSTTASLGDAPTQVGGVGELGPLARAAVWPTSVPGSFVSLEALARYAARTGAICVAKEGAGPAADGRPVLARGHEATVRALLTPSTVVVPYDRSLARTQADVEGALALEANGFAARIHFAHEGAVGFLAPGDPQERVYHAGIFLGTKPRPSRHGPVTVVVEDRSAVPTLGGDGLFWSAPLVDLGREEDALLERVVAAAEGDEIALERVKGYLEASATRLDERKKGADQAERKWLAALTERVRALPERREKERRRRLRDAVLARPRVDPRALPAPSATFSDGRGEATVALAADAATWSGGRANGDVLFDGRPLVRRPLAALPVVAIVEVRLDDLVGDDWTDLSQAGADWAQEIVVSAAAELARSLAPHRGFAEDAAALRLVLALLEGWPVYAAHLGLALARVRWPTVQGPPLFVGTQPSKLPWGALAYAPFVTAPERSPYDAPAVHAPRAPLGDLRRRVLEAAGHTLVDVTDAIERLQRRRARGHVAPPRLAGSAEHPVLRATLQELAVTGADGELEIIEGPASDVRRTDDRGITEALRVAMPVPVRAVFRAEVDTDVAAVVDEIRGAAERLVCRFGAHLDELPAHARHALRAVMVKGLRYDADRALAVFPDTGGAWRTLAEIRALGTVRVTQDPPPYPPHDGQGPILVASAAEAKALAPFARVDDVTEHLRRVRIGLERRSALPLDRIGLSDEMRARCMFTLTIAEPGITGEIGLLAPEHAGSRGIQVHTTRRPLCTIADVDGWPTVAAIDVDDLVANEAFDGFGPPEDVMRVRRAVHLAVGSRMAALLEAPADALGIVRLPMPFVVRRDAARMPCIGVFWLDRAWPEAPEVRLEAIGRTEPFATPRATSGIVPVRGKLWIAASGPSVDSAALEVFGWVLGRLPTLVEGASRSVRKPTPEDLEAYRWELALLGARDDRDPVAELARDRPDPILVRVAVRRAPHLLGDDPVPAAVPVPESPATPSGPATPPPPAEQPSFLAGLVRRILDVVSPPPPVADTPLARALAGALGAMKLTGDPVAEVVEVTRGRAVRYVAGDRRVLVNTKHASVRALANDPSQVLLLLLAAVSEINRELVPVTDAEEIAVLLDLLRDRQS